MFRRIVWTPNKLASTLPNPALAGHRVYRDSMRELARLLAPPRAALPHTTNNLLCVLVLMAGCKSTPPPLSPSVLVQPGTGKSFDAFRSDDAACRGQANTQAGNVNDPRL